MVPRAAAISRSERRKARTTAAILDAAERHFLERGFQEAKIDRIAEEADVAVGSIYNHFGSKEGLYGGLLERALELFETYMEEEGTEPVDGALEQLLDTAGRVARFGRERPGYMRILCLPQPRDDEALSAVADRVQRALADQERRTAALIEAAVRKGDARPLDSRRAAAFLWSAWKGTLTLGRAAERAAPGDDRELLAVIEAGLRVVIGGVASDRARESDGVVRALLESAPAPAAVEPAADALRRAPVLGGLRRDFPELGLWTAEADGGSGKSPAAVKKRLAAMGARLTGAEAGGARQESTPWAYRVLLRRLGIDPNTPRTAVEELALRRPGAEARLESAGLPGDALAIAALETGVPVLAFDAARLSGALALRRAREGERLGGVDLREGQVVIADHERPVAVLFGEQAPDAAVSGRTRRIALAAVQVKGVPDLGVEEALWTAIEVMRETA
jgi:TetR/AcrR family transcriptional regulator